jgi:5-methylcytosine-specific restriction endonuclease McrA
MPTKLSKKQLSVDKIFDPNNKGFSEWILREFLNNTELKLTLNGNSRHGIFYGDKRYNWEKQLEKNKVIALRLNGYNLDNINLNRPIRKDIRKHHLKTGCVLCGSCSDLVIDHKNDLYNDPIVLDIKTQSIDDFQCLCNHCNLQKREIIKKTKKTSKRYKATNIESLKIYGIDFIEGDETIDFNDINAMKGTYWYDIKTFNKYIYENLNIN